MTVLLHLRINRLLNISALRKDIKEYEKKEGIYREMVARYNEIPHENSLEGHEHETRDELNQKMKKFFAEMTNEYDKLHERILGTASTDFRNEEVDSLWRMVRISGF